MKQSAYVRTNKEIMVLLIYYLLPFEHKGGPAENSCCVLLLFIFYVAGFDQALFWVDS